MNERNEHIQQYGRSISEGFCLWLCSPQSWIQKCPSLGVPEVHYREAAYDPGHRKVAVPPSDS